MRTKALRMAWMVRADMAEALRADDLGWDEPYLLERLKAPNVIAMVALDESEDDRVVGFVVYSKGKHGIRILNMGVLHGFRRCWVGTLMVRRLEEKVAQRGKRRLLLADVPEEMLGFQLFLRSMGFVAYGIASGKDGVKYLFRRVVGQEGAHDED